MSLFWSRRRRFLRCFWSRQRNVQRRFVSFRYCGWCHFRSLGSLKKFLLQRLGTIMFDSQRSQLIRQLQQEVILGRTHKVEAIRRQRLQSHGRRVIRVPAGSFRLLGPLEVDFSLRIQPKRKTRLITTLSKQSVSYPADILHRMGSVKARRTSALCLSKLTLKKGKLVQPQNEKSLTRRLAANAPKSNDNIAPANLLHEER